MSHSTYEPLNLLSNLSAPAQVATFTQRRHRHSHLLGPNPALYTLFVLSSSSVHIYKADGHSLPHIPSISYHAHAHHPAYIFSWTFMTLQCFSGFQDILTSVLPPQYCLALVSFPSVTRCTSTYRTFPDRLLITHTPASSHLLFLCSSPLLCL